MSEIRSTARSRWAAPFAVAMAAISMAAWLTLAVAADPQPPADGAPGPTPSSSSAFDAADEPASAEPTGAEATRAALREAVAQGVIQAIVLTGELALASGADDAEARGYLTPALLAKGDLDRARTVATEGLQKFPGEALSLVTMARVHLAFGEFNEAGQSLYQAVRQDPLLHVAHLELGKLFEAERRMASAKRHYQTAYELAPNEPGAILAWAMTLVDPSERLALLEKYLTLDERPSERRRGIENAVELIRRVGDGGQCRLRGDPVATTLKIQEIRSQPGAANRHALKLNVNGGGEVRALVDTGASGVIVSESIARAAKLERLGPNLVLGLGDDGVREGWFGRATTLSAQGLVYEDCVVQVVPDDVRANHSTPALMGLDGLYRDFAIRFDFTGGELGLVPLPRLPAASQGRPDVYTYDRNAAAVPPGFYPARLFGNDIIVPVILNERLPSYFLIDSGASTTLISKRTAERLGPIRPSNTQIYGLSGRVQNVWTAAPATMNVLGLAQQHEDMLVIDLDGYAGAAGAGFNGLLGYTFLRHSILTVDDRNGFVRLEPGPVMRTPTRHREPTVPESGGGVPSALSAAPPETTDRVRPRPD